VSLRRFGGIDCCPIARARDAFSISLRDNSTRSITERLANSQALARHLSSRAWPFPPHFPAALPAACTPEHP
jgi:hypothetical protein